MEGLILHGLLCGKEKGTNDDQVLMIGNPFYIRNSI